MFNPAFDCHRPMNNQINYSMLQATAAAERPEIAYSVSADATANDDTADRSKEV